MRWLLALALVVHFTGLPAVGGMVCTGGAAGEHSCCEQETSARVGARVSGHCGCAMLPTSPAEARKPLGVAPESRDAAATVPSQQDLPGGDAPACEQIVRVVTLPGPFPSGFLIGAGFRC